MGQIEKKFYNKLSKEKLVNLKKKVMRKIQMFGQLQSDHCLDKFVPPLILITLLFNEVMVTRTHLDH